MAIRQDVEGLLGPKYLTAHVNKFLIETTQFLEVFAQSCQTKLESVAQRINSLESSLAILEAKLGKPNSLF